MTKFLCRIQWFVNRLQFGALADRVRAPIVPPVQYYSATSAHDQKDKHDPQALKSIYHITE